jgi:hypothetical protein
MAFDEKLAERVRRNVGKRDGKHQDNDIETPP